MDRVRAEAFAARAGASRQTLRAAALRQRCQRHSFSHSRHASFARTWKSEGGAFLSRRPYGRRQFASRDHSLAERKTGLAAPVNTLGRFVVSPLCFDALSMNGNFPLVSRGIRIVPISSNGRR